MCSTHTYTHEQGREGGERKSVAIWVMYLYLKLLLFLHGKNIQNSPSISKQTQYIIICNSTSHGQPAFLSLLVLSAPAYSLCKPCSAPWLPEICYSSTAVRPRGSCQGDRKPALVNNENTQLLSSMAYPLLKDITGQVPRECSLWLS